MPITGAYDADSVLEYLKSSVEKLVVVRGQPIREYCAKTLNTALLGAAAQSGIFPFEPDDLLEAISDMPRFRDENLKSFNIGRKMYDERQSY